jgi:hypothetical protein
MRITIIAGCVSLLTLASASFNPSVAAPKRASTAASIPTSGELSAADLVQIIRLALKARSDQYVSDGSLAYEGREFRVILPGYLVITQYSRDSQSLDLSIFGIGPVFEIGRDLKDGRYSGRNGFGAAATVERQTGRMFGIERHPGDGVASLKLAPAAAKALAPYLRLRLTGKIAPLTGFEAFNKITGDDLHYHPPTLDAPTDIDVHKFYLGATIEKAEWIDSRSGAVVLVMPSHDAPH